MLLQAAAALEIDLSQSWMIGDSDTDAEAGRLAGCTTILIENPRSAHRRSADSHRGLPSRRRRAGRGHRRERERLSRARVDQDEDLRGRC